MLKKVLKLISAFVVVCLMVFIFVKQVTYIEHLQGDSRNKKELLKYKDTINELFAQCPQNVDVSYVPKRFEDLEGKGFRHELLSQYLSTSCEDEKEIEYDFFRSLGDKPELGKSHVAFSKNTVNRHAAKRAYYDYHNKLLYVEKEVEVAWSGICSYSPEGKLLRTFFQDNELMMFFNPQKELIYRCYRGYCSSKSVPFPN